MTHPFTCAYCTGSGDGERLEWPTRDGFLMHMERRHFGLPLEYPTLDVDRLALYMHQARTSNDEPIFDMTEARRRAEVVVARLTEPEG